jgi:hypothetical protein
MVERFWPAACNAQNGPIASTTHEMLRDGNGAWVRYSDYASLQKELAERTKERDEAKEDAKHWSLESSTYAKRLDKIRERIAVKGGDENYPTEDAYVAACRAIDKHRARATALAKKVEEAIDHASRLEHAVAFTAKMAWRTDPPNANNKLTDSERLSAIKHHPTIKRYGQPDRDLAAKEAALEAKP